jgi:hypothetical protein
MSGFSINRRGIEKMTQEIQREFDKHPIQIDVQAHEDTQLGQTYGTTIFGKQEPGNTINYYGPVIHGNADGAQLAWGNQTANQSIQQAQQITAGFEAIAQAVAKTLEGLPTVGLNDDDLKDGEEISREILYETVQPEPNRNKIRRALSSLKGILAPIATGLVVGGAEGAHEWARVAIEQLGKAF